MGVVLALLGVTQHLSERTRIRDHSCVVCQDSAVWQPILERLIRVEFKKEVSRCVNLVENAFLYLHIQGSRFACLLSA